MNDLRLSPRVLLLGAFAAILAALALRDPEPALATPVQADGGTLECADSFCVYLTPAGRTYRLHQTGNWQYVSGGTPD